MRGAKSRRNHAQAPRCPLPVMSHITLCLIFTPTNCDSTYKALSTREAHWSLGVRVFIGVSHIGTQGLHDCPQHSDSSPPGQKEVFSINHIVGISYLITLVPCGPVPQAYKTFIRPNITKTQSSSPRSQSCKQVFLGDGQEQNNPSLLS